MMEQLPQVFLADHALSLETGIIFNLYISVESSSNISMKSFFFVLDSQLISSRHAHKKNTIENLTDRLKTALVSGISRKQADEWRRRWFRVYAFRGQLYV